MDADRKGKKENYRIKKWRENLAIKLENYR